MLAWLTPILQIPVYMDLLRGACTDYLILHSCLLLSALKNYVLVFITFNTIYSCVFVLIRIQAKLLSNNIKNLTQDSVAYMRHNLISHSPNSSQVNDPVLGVEGLNIYHVLFF